MDKMGSGSADLTDEAFEMVFKNFDKDGSGTVEKDKMAVFINEIFTGLNKI